MPVRRGFFPESRLIRKTPPALVPLCGQCGLFRTCKSPYMPVDGRGERRILVVGEAPGRNEDEQGRPFVGEAGKKLESVLARCGVDLRRDCWITNSLRCHPPKNAKPTPGQVDCCRPFLRQALEELDPDVVVPLGEFAVRSLIGGIWKSDAEEVRKIGRWVGWTIPCRQPNLWICPAWHPAFLLRQHNPVAELKWEQHLRAAAELSGKPWRPGDLAEPELDLLLDTDEAARLLRLMVRKGGPVAFDYETDALKPDDPALKIVSAAVCWRGRKTVAFPWRGEAVAAFRELLRSRLPKYGANKKFEDRWTATKLGGWPVNWWWDTMEAAHVLDNRPGITSVKFQAFVMLGHRAWDEKVSPYLESGGKERGYARNRVREVDLTQLLRYNALDALYEYQLAEAQMRFAGYPMPGSGE